MILAFNNMSYQYRYILLFIMFSSLYSCLDSITLDIPESPEVLVIDGSLNLTESVQQVTLSRTLPFKQKIFNPESGAQVTLITENEELTYSEVREGIYELILNDNFLAPNEQYSLRVITNTGDEYESISDRMPSMQTADKAEAIFEREIITLSTGVENIDDVLNAYLSTDIIVEPDQEVYLKWFFDEFYLFTDNQCSPLDLPMTCYVPIPGDNQNFALLRSNDLRSNRVENIKVASKKSFPLREFQNRHYFIIYQQAITKTAHDYWSRVIDVTRQSGTIFDRPPASVRGNFRNIQDPELPVLGLFELTAVDTIRPFVMPSEFATARTREVACNPFNRRAWPAECCNCLTILDATLDRPSWVN